MKKNVIISIRGLQQAEGYVEDGATLITDGLYYKRDGRYFVRYEESELTGLPGARTTLRIDKNQVTVMRRGPYSFDLVFEPEKTQTTLYNTDAGGLMVSVFTQNIDNNLTDSGGSLDVRYAVNIEGAYLGVKHLRIYVSESMRELQ